MNNSKTSFGFDQISNPTPEYANWIFRSYFIISKAFVGWAAAVMLFSSHQQFVILTTVSLLGDPIMYGFSKLFGIVPTDLDPSQPLVATAQVNEKGDTVAISPVVVPSVDAGTDTQPAPVIKAAESTETPEIIANPVPAL